MNLQKIEQWFDTKSWLGWPRSAWVGIALGVGIVINLTIIYIFKL